MRNRWLTLVFWLVVCFAASAVGGYFTSESVDTWYTTLQRPSYNPPSWVFAPVWTALYAMMAVAVWRLGNASRDKLPRVLFSAQLAANVLWSVLFFGQRSPGAAFIDIIVLWALISATILTFYNRDRIAGLLLVPYLAWVSFAAVLNYAIWRLN